MATKESPQEAEIGLDDDDIIDLLEVVKPGKAVVSDNSGSMDEFSADLDSMLENLEKKERAELEADQPFPDPTPVDHEVDHNETLDLPSMNDLDSLLESLGAAPAEDGLEPDAEDTALDVSDALDSFMPDSEAGIGDADLPDAITQDELATLADLGDTIKFSSSKSSDSPETSGDAIFDHGIAPGDGASFAAALGVALESAPDAEQAGEELFAEGSAPEEPVLEERAFEEPVFEELATEELATEELVTEEPEAETLVAAEGPQDEDILTVPPDTLSPDAENSLLAELGVVLDAQPTDAPINLDADIAPDFGEEVPEISAVASPERARKDVVVDVDDLPEAAKGGIVAELPDFSDIELDDTQSADAAATPEIPELQDNAAEAEDVPAMPEPSPVPASPRMNGLVSTIDEDLSELDAILDDMLSSSMAPEVEEQPAQAAPAFGEGQENADLFDASDSYALILRMENLENSLEYQVKQQVMAEGVVADLEPRIVALEELVLEQQKRIEALENGMEKMVAAAAAKVIREEIEGLVQNLSNGGA